MLRSRLVVPALVAFAVAALLAVPVVADPRAAFAPANVRFTRFLLFWSLVLMALGVWRLLVTRRRVLLAARLASER